MKEYSLVEQWYDAYSSSLYGFVLTVTGKDQAKAEQLFILAFCRVIKCQKEYDPIKDRILPWLLRQAIQVLIENGYEIVNFHQQQVNQQSAEPLSGEFPMTAFSPVLV